MTEQRFDLVAADDEIAVFVDESDELLESLATCVLRLEREPTSPLLLQEIFRITHTIKGSAASIGDSQMATVAHSLETLLDQLRSGMLLATPEIVDALLRSRDVLRELTDEIRTRSSAGLDVSALVHELTRVGLVHGDGEQPNRQSGQPTPGPDQSPNHVAPPLASALANASDRSLTTVGIRLTESAPMPAVTAFQVLMRLSDVGQIVRSRPSEREIESEQMDRSLEVEIDTTASPDEIARLVRSVVDVESVTVGGEECIVTSALPVASSQPVEPEPTLLLGAAVGRTEAAAPTSDRRVMRPTRTVRLDVQQLDALMNLVGELVIQRTHLQSIASRAEAAFHNPGELGDMATSLRHLERITAEFQSRVMKARMLPIEQVFSRLPRVVRDLARRSGKSVDLVIEGADTELDRSVIEEIGDPLIHLLRNSIDHGIETPAERLQAGKPESGTVRLLARHESGQIVVSVSDDGRGIDGRTIRQSALDRDLVSIEQASAMNDVEAVNLIFAPGLTTAPRVSDVSGRGVGMDIVRASLEQLNGSIAIETAVGHGTTFTIRLPLTLATVRALIVETGGATYALPLSSVVEAVRVEQPSIQRANRRLVVDLRGSILPLVPLAALLGARPDCVVDAICDFDPTDERYLVVTVQYGTRQVGLIVDRLVGEQEIVIKPLDPLFGDISGLSGTAILGDGRITPILYVPGLVKDLAYSGSPGIGVRASTLVNGRREGARV